MIDGCPKDFRLTLKGLLAFLGDAASYSQLYDVGYRAREHLQPPCIARRERTRSAVNQTERSYGDPVVDDDGRTGVKADVRRPCNQRIVRIPRIGRSILHDEHVPLLDRLVAESHV